MIRLLRLNITLLQKILVVVPPEPIGPAWEWDIADRDGVEDMRVRWDEIRRYWAAEGGALPEYEPKGLIYHPHKDLSVDRSQLLN